MRATVRAAWREHEKEMCMLTTTESMEGIYLHDLARGSVIDVETKSHNYRIEYLGGDEIRISGHPSLCPTPVSAQLRGSVGAAGTLQAGYVGRGMRLAFRRENDDIGVVTSAITDVWVEHA
jgi:hypothetical protein